MKKGIILACLAALPFVGMADITVNAYAQDGAIAYLYDSTGATYGSTTFTGGSATIPTGGLSIPGPASGYGVAIGYAPGQAWYSNIAWANGAGGSQYKNIVPGYTDTLTALTGAISSRTLSGTTGTVTLTANGDLTLYNNDNNELDAQLGLYRPMATLSEYGNTITKQWNGAGLGGDFSYSASTWSESASFSLITVMSNGNFYADYVGINQGGEVYDIYLYSMDKGTAFADGSIANIGNDVKFTVDGLGTGDYADQTPYYLLMDAAWMYDPAYGGNYSEAYDAGMMLTQPDYYVVPEPAVITLILGAGGLMLVGRRFIKR